MSVRGLLLILPQGIVVDFLRGWLLTFPEGFFE